ncbi:MAG: triacylglycerol lipase [Merismopediaceae bacterium]|nr:triacylglycerol lipase [Merismopediaceae bacterium]
MIHAPISRNPVLLVHGIHDTVSKFKTLQSYLTDRGWSVHALNLTPNDGSAPLEVLAQQVADYVSDRFPPEQPIDLLGFSMGGVVTRYYLQRLGGHQKVQRYISISAPNRGTWLGFSLPLPGVRQMSPGSQFLVDLNRDHHQFLATLKVTIIWTPFDLMILPAVSSQLGLGKEIVLPVPVHSWMVSDRRTLTVVKEALLEPL